MSCYGGCGGGQLAIVDSFSNSDAFVIAYRNNCGDYRVGYGSTLVQFVQDNLSFTGIPEYSTQYSAPSANGFSVQINAGASNDENVHLILTPTGAFAAGTIVLPQIPGAVDKQQVLVNCTQAVAALTITLNGATAVTGAPSALAANDFFTLKLDLATQTWYRVG